MRGSDGGKEAEGGEWKESVYVGGEAGQGGHDDDIKNRSVWFGWIRETMIIPMRKRDN